MVEQAKLRISVDFIRMVTESTVDEEDCEEAANTLIQKGYKQVAALEFVDQQELIAKGVLDVVATVLDEKGYLKKSGQSAKITHHQ